MKYFNNYFAPLNKLILLILLSITANVQAQVGGRHIYEFLDLPASARLTGLGDMLITVSDHDVTLAYANPAVLNDRMHRQMAFNHKFFLSGIHHGYFSYGSKISKYGIMAHGGIQYIRYGDFVAADIYGNKTGTFVANETALILGASRNINERLRVGLNTKLIQSRFESYSSIGLTTDLGLVYSNPKRQLDIGLVFKNIGTQLTQYEDLREPVPFDVQLGISQKLKHLPFRFSVVAHHLHRWNILYDDPNEENTLIILGEDNEKSELSVFADNLFRHVIFSGEFLIGKGEIFSLRIAYNHLRRKELTVDNYISFAGFSLGAGIKFNKFRLDYGYSIYHLAGGSSHIGISTNLDAFRKKI